VAGAGSDRLFLSREKDERADGREDGVFLAIHIRKGARRQGVWSEIHSVNGKKGVKKQND